MSELFDDDDKVVIDEEFIEADELLLEAKGRPGSDARRRLEDFLDEKRLRDELEDFLD